MSLFASEHLTLTPTSLNAMKYLFFLVLFLGLSADAFAQRYETRVGNSTYYTTYARDGRVYSGSSTRIGNTTFHNGYSSAGNSYSGYTTRNSFGSSSTINYSNGGFSSSYTTGRGSGSTTSYFGSSGAFSTRINY